MSRIGKQILYRPYKRIASFNGYFYKEDFLDWLLDLEILFDFENISYERKVGLALYKLVSMPYVGGNEYNLIKPDKVNTKFVHDQGWKRCYQILSFGLWWTFVVYKTRLLLLLVKKFILELLWKANIPPLKEESHVEENIILEDYVEVKEKNIEISEEINEGLVMEEDPKIKIIVEENNEDPIKEKVLEVKMVETIEEEIEKEVFKTLNEIKSHNCQSQDPFILVVSDTLKFIDFIGVNRFDSIVSSYLENLYNYMKTI